jgi:DNA repair protein RecO
MHHIHHSEAFVLGSRPKGEDSKLLILYTRELGLIYAHAQGVRKISSKLRFVTQDFSRVQVDLVRGKEIWRLTTASPIASHAEISRSAKAERIVAHIAALLIRLVTGEEKNEEVFRAVTRAYDLLTTTNDTTDYRVIELLSVARILVALGYISRDVLGVEEEGTHETPKVFADIAYQHRLIRDINQALSASQL